MSSSDDSVSIFTDGIAESIFMTAFTKKKPLPEYIEALSPYQELARHCRSRWTIAGDVHQASETDRLHLSVYYTSEFYRISFHIYGYIRSSFIITEITKSSNSKDYTTLAKFPVPAAAPENVVAARTSAYYAARLK